MKLIDWIEDYVESHNEISNKDIEYISNNIMVDYLFVDREEIKNIIIKTIKNQDKNIQ